MFSFYFILLTLLFLLLIPNSCFITGEKAGETEKPRIRIYLGVFIILVFMASEFKFNNLKEKFSEVKRNMDLWSESFPKYLNIDNANAVTTCVKEKTTVPVLIKKIHENRSNQPQFVIKPFPNLSSETVGKQSKWRKRLNDYYKSKEKIELSNQYSDTEKRMRISKLKSKSFTERELSRFKALSLLQPESY